MRDVHFVKGLVIERAQVASGQEVVEHHLEMEPLTHIDYDSDFYLRSEAKVERRVVPIHEIRGGAEGDIYLAYSKEVQLLLQMPFDLLREENDRVSAMNRVLRGEVDAVRNAPWRQRLKFLFTGSLGSLLAR